MLYLFHTEVAVLCGSIESIHYAIFVSYRSGCLLWFHRVYTLCYICFIQKWLSYVVPSSRYIMLYLFHAKVVVLCGSIESIQYVIFVSYRSGCLTWINCRRSTILIFSRTISLYEGKINFVCNKEKFVELSLLSRRPIFWFSELYDRIQFGFVRLYTVNDKKIF